MCRIQSIPPPYTLICCQSMQSYAPTEYNGIPPVDEFAKKQHHTRRRRAECLLKGNFRVDGYTTGIPLKLRSVVSHPLLQPRRQSNKCEERKGNGHHFQVVLCAFLRRIQCID